MLEKRISGERSGIDPGVTVSHQYEPNAGGASGGGIVFVVADHGGRRNPGAELVDQPQEVTGVGLPDREAVAAGDGVEQREQAQTLDDRDGRSLRLVGADRGSIAA